MDVIFSIDNKTAAATDSGPFIKNSVEHTDITDGTEISTRAFNKMSTSIPTPFARMYLYDGAFEALVKLEEWDDGAGNHPNQGTAFHGLKDPSDRHNFLPTLNHYVVADCLDMLEFLFEYGGDSRLVIEKWDNIHLQRLKTELEPDPTRRGVSTEEKHNQLYTALKSDTVDGKIGDYIYIFKWVEGGTEYVIGGSSPFTLVYTAPNWRSIKPTGKTYSGGVGNDLFAKTLTAATKPIPLIKRSEAFRKYLYGLLNNYAAQNLNPFFKYISLTKQNYDTRYQAANITQAMLDSAYSSLHNKVGDIKIDIKSNAGIYHIPLKYYDKKSLDAQSEYIIQPTVTDIKKEYKSNGEEVDVAKAKAPLVLSVNGISGKASPHYWYEAKIGRESSDLKTPSDKPYYERTLPNVPGSIEHPNLRAEDFFEDKLVKMSYRLDRSHFITGFSGHCQYLLPLKPVYFKYFRPEDLKKYFTMTEQNDGSVVVKLTVPVKGGEVVFDKTYKNDHGINLKQIELKDKFNIAIFPFYRLEGDDAKYNCYEVMLADDGKTALKFYNDDVNEFTASEIKALAGRSIVKVSEPMHRTQDDTTILGIHTTYYKLGESEKADRTPSEAGSFKFIQARFADGNRGLIVPDWSVSKSAFGNDDYIFCVDFGTANTHVAYGKIAGTVIKTESLKDLEYKAREQVVTLNEAGSYGTFSHFDIYFQREFVPMSIAKGTDVEFPIRTIIYEKSECKPKKLFGDMNIGFSLKEDEDKGQGNGQPKSNIKWGEDTDTNNRIAAFFTEIMWIIKNKVLSLGGSIDFKFLFTFPQSMRDPQQTTFANEWNKARREVRGGLYVGDSDKSNNWDKSTKTSNQRPLKPYEGTAPWYRSLEDHSEHENFMNIDIGGGTFDVITILPNVNNPKSVPGKAFSAQFAASELWGHGQGTIGKATNGFLTLYLSSDECTEYKKENPGFENYQKTAESPSDTIAYLFKHDEVSKFSEVIGRNGQLRSLVLLHFSAIIYYVGRVLMLAEIECPGCMRFTGMGSLYIDLITESEEDLTNLVRAILRYATNNNVEIPADFKVEYDRTKYHPKKITAEGGVIMWNTTLAGTTTPIVDTNEIVVYGFEGDQDYIQPLKETEMSSKEAEVMERMKHFLAMFQNNEITSLLSPMGFTNLTHLQYNNIQSKLKSSFKKMAMKYNNNVSDTVSKEAIFFWPLKEGIHALAEEYSK